MNEDEVQASDPLRDRPQVRIFTLAEHAVEEPTGRLYISGGGLEWAGVPALSNLLPSFYLVLRLAFPIAIARERHRIEVRALDRDGSPVGPDPLLQAEVQFDIVGAPKDAVEMSGTLPVQVTNYPVSVDADAVIFLHLIVDDLPISRLPLQLRSIDQG